MALIKSISGIRGTIGGKPGEGLSPLDLVKFTAAYLSWVKREQKRHSKAENCGSDAMPEFLVKWLMPSLPAP